MTVVANTAWRYFITDRNGVGITDFSHLASDRSCRVLLNTPLALRGAVPSDDPQVWLPYTDGYGPYLDEGIRFLYGFRRQSDTPPYYTVQAATLLGLVEDDAVEDDAVTRFTGYDPLHYCFSRPVCDFDGNLPDENGMTVATVCGGAGDQQAADVICNLIGNTIFNHGSVFIDAGAAFGGTGSFVGTLETGAGMLVPAATTFQQGMSVGEAIAQLTDAGYCDLWMQPIYEPMVRPEFLVQLNVYAQKGAEQPEVIFAWNAPGRTLVALNRQEDGGGRANRVRIGAGMGGLYGYSPTQTDAASITKYSEYWAQQFMPAVTDVAEAESIADAILLLRSLGKTTVTWRPAEEQSPTPWGVDYTLGDRVQVWATPERFRKALGIDTPAGSLANPTQYQRVWGWHADISDDAMESVTVFTSPEATA